MQDLQLMKEGLTLMGLGMGFVSVFLTLLVIITTLMSRAIECSFPKPVVSAVTARCRGAPQPSLQGVNEDMVAVNAAVHRYRRRHLR
ncbi:OadG family transporter subunit [Vreelandella glaciei]|uniref:OadG family protein n=1 Tax=Vreelandella glaciei TaxID=186761 RepID=UPI003001E47E